MVSTWFEYSQIQINHQMVKASSGRTYLPFKRLADYDHRRDLVIIMYCELGNRFVHNEADNFNAIELDHTTNPIKPTKYNHGIPFNFTLLDFSKNCASFLLSVSRFPCGRTRILNKILLTKEMRSALDLACGSCWIELTCAL